MGSIIFWVIVLIVIGAIISGVIELVEALINYVGRLISCVVEMIGVLIGRVVKYRKYVIYTIFLIVFFIWGSKFIGTDKTIIYSAIIMGVFYGAWRLIKLLSDVLKIHDQRKSSIAQMNSETARINAKAAEIKRRNDNVVELQNELETHWRWKGQVTEEDWKRYLPNHATKEYPVGKNFEEITYNFAKQLESEQLISSDDWFKPFLQKIINGGIISFNQLVHDVECPALKITHVTPNQELIFDRLEDATKPKSIDVPALLVKTETEGNIFFRATEYAIEHLGRGKQTCSLNTMERINFNDL